jgi:hypothetical protein
VAVSQALLWSLQTGHNKFVKVVNFETGRLIRR